MDLKTLAGICILVGFLLFLLSLIKAASNTEKAAEKTESNAEIVHNQKDSLVTENKATKEPSAITETEKLVEDSTGGILILLGWITIIIGIIGGFLLAFLW